MAGESNDADSTPTEHALDSCCRHQRVAFPVGIGIALIMGVVVRQREELSGNGGLNQCLPNVGRADRLEAPDYVDGMSLVPWLKGPSKPMEQPAMTTWGRGNYSLRTKEWRYTRYFDGTEEAPQVKSGRELYNVADPDSPTRNIESYKNNVKQYEKAGLQPPLD